MSPAKWHLIALLSLLGMAAACGSAEFSGGTPSKPGTSDQTPEPAGPEGLNWLWSCADSADPAASSASGKDLVIQGKGPHKVSKKKFDGKPVYVKGSLCAPPKTKRDIVLVIDVSGSMGPGGLLSGGADPMRNNSCGRLEAVKAVLDMAAKTGDAQFGIVTFSTQVASTSSALFTNEADLYADLIKGTTGATDISQVLCNANGNTNYDFGLQGGWNLLKLSQRTDAAKELYFISDGVPDPFQYDGVKLAKEIRKEASVATVMLGSASDQVMKDFIASRDSGNRPYHANAANSGELTKVLSTLAENKIQGGTMKYRPVGQTAWTEVDMTPHMKSGQFTAPSFKADPASSPDGIELQFTYWDRFGHKFENSGTIVWEENATR